MNEIDGVYETLDSTLLRTFLAVAQSGSVTGATEVLHRTQSAISVQIRRLEEALGVPLFERRPRGVALTSHGERLFADAAEIVRRLDETARSFAAPPISGQVSVGIPDEYGTPLLTRVLRDFSSRCPDVEVSVHCGFSTAFPEAVRRGDLDLAVYADDEAGGGGEVLVRETTVWVSRADGTAHLQEEVPLALFDRSCWWRDAALAALRRAGRRFRIAYTSESVAGVKAAVAVGAAVGMLARGTVDPGLRIVGADFGFPDLPPSNLVLIQARPEPSPAAAAMAAAIRRGFGGLAA